jgi:hypothetical protein
MPASTNLSPELEPQRQDCGRDLGLCGGEGRVAYTAVDRVGVIAGSTCDASPWILVRGPYCPYHGISDELRYTMIQEQITQDGEP